MALQVQVGLTEVINIKNPGIYSERMGKLQKTIAYWKFVFYVDSSKFYADTQMLQSDFNVYSKLCDELSQGDVDQCRQTKKLLNRTLIDIKSNNEIIEQLFNPQHFRPKRSLFNGIGKVQNVLFGVMDSDDAERIDQTIRNLNLNQKQLHHIEEVQSTVKSF